MPTGLIKAERQRRVRKIMGRVDVSAGTPSVGVGEGFTVVDTAAGQVQVVLTKPGKVILGVSALVLETTDATAHMIKVDAKTEASSVTFGVYVADATDGALVDNVGFYFEITVKDVSN